MSDAPRCDFHIHTKYLGCANETMEVARIAAECERIGATVIGITDHLNTPGQTDLHRPIKADIESLDTSLDVYFGVELNFMDVDGEFAIDAATKERLGFQFAIGGIHATYLDAYDPRELVEIQHRHHLKACRDELVDVLVHPYWFSKHPFDRNGWPWFDSMEAVPETYARELGRVARETNTAIEINACANLVNPAYSERYVKEYVAYLAVVAQEGPLFALGSDAHAIGRLETIRTVWDVAAKLGLGADRIWRPPGEPMRSGGG
jgi:histidinol phosphatase-like PHP family hydrolase